MREFIYNVQGTEITDTEAFGEGWKKAKALATEMHTTIERTVIDGNNVRNEFFANGGVFLNMRFYQTSKAKVF